MITGLVQAFHVDLETKTWLPRTDVIPNLRMNAAVSIMARLLTSGDPKYKLSGMYLEFANAVPPITAPSFTAVDAEGKAYYNGLSSNPTRDYLRVGLESAIVLPYTNNLYPDGHAIKVHAASEGTVGVHGKAFSSGANSTVIGGAVVAIVDPLDPTKDIVFARFYLPQDQQLVKPSTLQIGLSWTIPLV